MPRAATRTRAGDRLLTGPEAAVRAGYSAEGFRKLMWQPNPPPMRKMNGRWKVLESDLDRWIEERLAAG
jgi:hypothetical protein